MNNGKRITRRRWTGAEDDKVRELHGRIPAADIGQRIDRTEDAIWIRARHLGLCDEVRPWTDAELDEVRRCYALERPAGIARRLGRTTSAVSQQAAVLGLLSAKALVAGSTVHDYFGSVASPEQAYLLGLLAADGNVASDYPRVSIGLQAKDAHLVEFVRDRLNPGASLHRKGDGFTSLQLTSRQMVADLALHGIVPRKSRTLPWPAHLGELLRPYLLGYFDGDGCMYLPRDRNGRERPGWTVCSGSERFLVDLKAYVLETCGVELQKIQHRAGADLWQVAVTGRGAFLVGEFLLQDGLGLARKRFPESVVARYRLT